MLSNIFNFENNLVGNSWLIKASFYWLQQMLLFAFRVWIFNVFFFSGWLKFTSWETTLMLFEYEYSVPIIPFYVAAYLATFAEILFPAFLLLGIFPRFSALALLCLNIIAAISYADISTAGMQQHIIWSVIMITLLAYGSGRLSLDFFAKKSE